MMRAAALMACVACVAAEGASLAVFKQADSEHAVEGRNLTVTVKIYNLGKATAQNVELEDTTWTNVDGVGIKTTFDSIAADASETVTYSVVPQKAGAIVANEPAKVTFKVQDASGAEAIRASFSNHLYDNAKQQGFETLTQAQFDRKASRRVKEWAMFVLLLVLPLGIPAYLFQQSANDLEERRKAGVFKPDDSKTAKKSPAKRKSPARK